jgi:hypothetical protein
LITIPIKHPAMIPASGNVMIQPAYIQATILQLIARHVPEHKPTPTVAPVMHCVVLIGNANRVANMTVIAEPSSMLNPRDGLCRVKRFPRLRMILYP